MLFGFVRGCSGRLTETRVCLENSLLGPLSLLEGFLTFCRSATTFTSQKMLTPSAFIFVAGSSAVPLRSRQYAFRARKVSLAGAGEELCRL